RARPDRHARRLRAGRLRGVHGAPRRRPRPLVPALRRPGRGRLDRHGRGPGNGRGAPPDPACLLERARPPVRLLHAGPPADGPGPPRGERRPVRARDPRGALRQRLPLHRLRRRRGVGHGSSSPATGGDVSRPEQYVGARLPRFEDHRFLTGRGRFVDDLEFPGMLHAAFYRSPFGHARIGSVDVERARALPGVAAVVTGGDLRDFPPFSTGLPRPEVRANERRVLPVDRVRFAGEAVVAVAASSRYVAEDACALIEVDWEPLDAIVDADASLAPGAQLLHEASGSNSFAHIELEHGDVERAFAEAAHVFTKRFHHGRMHAAPLEPRGIVAQFEPGTGTFTMWTSSQIPHLTRSLLAHMLGLTFEN